MQAVIMAGGKGTRLAAITKDEIPKPMVLINGKPLLLWQVEELKSHGIHDVIMVIGHLGSKIQEYFGDGSQFGVSITYIIEDTPLGTAGAFFYLKNYLAENPFLLVFGDVIFLLILAGWRHFTGNTLLLLRYLFTQTATQRIQIWWFLRRITRFFALTQSIMSVITGMTIV